MQENLELLWTDPAWIAQAHAWITETLKRVDIRLNGEIEQLHIRPWSTVMIAPTDHGKVYFKACDEFSKFEPGLTRALYQWRPDCIVQVFAADTVRAWMLMADEGVPLRTLVSTVQDLRHWVTLMPLFAGLQIDMVQRCDELLRLGAADRRLERLPSLFESMIHDREAMCIGKDDGLSQEQYDRLRDFAPRYAEMCELLAQFALPATLHHDDFHNSNVYVRGSRYTFSDWGECCVAHPFFSIIITLRNIADRLGLPDEIGISPESLTPELNHLRDLYLGPWSDHAPLATLQEAFRLAWRVGMVNRAISWYLSLQPLDPQTRDEYAYTVPAWLGEFLQTV